MVDMADIRAIKTSVKLTSTTMGCAWERCRCCFSPETLETLKNPLLEVFRVICKPQRVEIDENSTKACLQCHKFLNEVHRFRIKCHTVDKYFRNNLNIENVDVKLLSKNSINDGLSIECVKMEPEIDYSEIRTMDIEINQMKVDCEPESQKNTLETNNHEEDSNEPINPIEKTLLIELHENMDFQIDTQSNGRIIKNKLIGNKRKNTKINRKVTKRLCKSEDLINESEGGESQTELSEQLAVEQIESQMHRKHILHEGYRFRRDKVLADGGASWRCPKKNCSGRVKISREGVVTVVSEHNHAPDPIKNKAMKIISEIRQRAMTSAETPRQIIDQAMAGISYELACHLPEYTASQRMIQRQRKKQDLIFPSDSIGINIPEQVELS